MKTKILYYAVFAFILSSLLASCSFLQKEKFSTRKYYNFPLTKHSSDGLQAELATVPFQKTVTEKVSAKEEALFSEEIITASVDEKKVPVACEEIKSFYFHKVKPVIETKIKNEPPVVSLMRTDVFRIAPEKMAHPAPAGSNGMLILELLLAIILPPLGVLVHRGRISKWFWITLALCIAGGAFLGLTYVGYGSLLWAISALVAICYVLGMMKD